MMRKKCLPLLLIAGVVVLFASTGIYAGKDVADSFIIESPEYTKRTRNNVEFTHNNHITEYKIGCGECHHDENNKPLADLKIGDDVQRCIECHKIPGRKRPPRG